MAGTGDQGQRSRNPLFDSSGRLASTQQPSSGQARTINTLPSDTTSSSEANRWDRPKP